jgi:hypothetical protein
MSVVVVACKPYAGSTGTTIWINACMIGTDVDVCGVCSNVSVLLSDGLVDILDIAIGRIVALSRVS